MTQQRQQREENEEEEEEGRRRRRRKRRMAGGGRLLLRCTCERYHQRGRPDEWWWKRRRRCHHPLHSCWLGLNPQATLALHFCLLLIWQLPTRSAGRAEPQLANRPPGGAAAAYRPSPATPLAHGLPLPPHPTSRPLWVSLPLLAGSCSSAGVDSVGQGLGGVGYRLRPISNRLIVDLRCDGSS